jgi:peptidylprolyl isomerase
MSDTARVSVEGDLGAKPEVLLPAGDPPYGLLIHDVVEGDGPAVEPGATVNTHYVGIGWDTKRQFDSSWDRGQPISFPLDRVIAGWTQGIPGMKVGGRRLLVIPAGLAYGDRPPPGSGIGRGETLVFVIDLLG